VRLSGLLIIEWPVSESQGFDRPVFSLRV
jgi:hypothetical protein